MSISSEVFVITKAIILPFFIEIAHAIQVSNITNPIIDFLRFTTVPSIVITHLDDVLRITMTIADTMIIWATVFSVIVTFFIEIDKVTFAIINQEVGFAVWRWFPEEQQIYVWIVTDVQLKFCSLGFMLTLSIASLSQSQWCNIYHPKTTSPSISLNNCAVCH